ncbi:hypothetical protein [uncultured Hymenobacter sp.]|uniref:hypothetical protein n=1 Tax=uncultured Hymenobacter sp. TaxID=170016 RepID=UPI0035CB936A
MLKRGAVDIINGIAIEHTEQADAFRARIDRQQTATGTRRNRHITHERFGGT